MKRRVKLFWTGMLAALVTFCCSACGGSDPADSGADKKPLPISKLVVGTTMKIEKAVRDEYNFDVLASGVSEIPLVAKNAQGEFSPLAASYTTQDSIRWTYTVKDGLTWTDGQEVTAEDIVFSMQYESSDSTPYFSQNGVVGTYSSYEISADKKSVTLVRESADVQGLETLRIRPKHIYEGKAEGEITEDEARITCGPYRLQSFDKSSSTLTFVQNECYPETPNVSTIVYQLYSSEEVMYTALKQGDVDMVWNYSTGVSKTYQDVLAASDTVTMQSVATSACPAVLAFNNKQGFGSELNVRNAVAYALDYNAFNKAFGSEYASVPNRSFAPSALTGFKQTEKLSHDLAKADEYMQKAGYTKQGEFYQRNGKRATFTLTVNSSKKAHINYAEYVKNQLDSFGIEVKLDLCDSTLYNEKTSHKFAREGANAYNDITMEGAIMGYTAFGMKNFGGMYINGNNNVQGGAQVYDERLNVAMSQMESARTMEEYTLAAEALQDFYAEQLPVIALYWDSVLYAYSSNLTNVVIDATFGINNVNTWFGVEKK